MIKKYTITEIVRMRINSLQKGELFSSKIFRDISLNYNIRKVLSRMVETGEVERVSRGVYMRPKLLSNGGYLIPKTDILMRKITELTGETIIPQGAEAVRYLRLSSQVPMRLIFYTNGTSRAINIGKEKITLKHVNPSKIIAPNTIQGAVFSALFYLEKDKVSLRELDQIKEVIGAKEFLNLYSYIHEVPIWMADLLLNYKKACL